jgi:hypothetical protein
LAARASPVNFFSSVFSPLVKIRLDIAIG